MFPFENFDVRLRGVEDRRVPRARAEAVSPGVSVDEEVARVVLVFDEDTEAEAERLAFDDSAFADLPVAVFVPVGLVEDVADFEGVN